MKCLGKDLDGITQVSLESIKEYTEKHLISISIEKISSTEVSSTFKFDDNTYYVASGFNIGYGGEGPRGLWKAISLWYPNLYPEFSDSKISSLQFKSYIWNPETGWN